MKIQFDNVDFGSMTGPNTFGRRLAKCFFELGHEITNESNADISLVFIEPSGRKLTKRIVQRLDGIWFSPDQFETHNTRIKSLYEMADAVIWQSNFDKNMTTRWWNNPRKGFVISNGVCLKFSEDKNLSEKLLLLHQKYDKIFVCSANWHGQKRLSENVDLFNHLKKFYNSSCLLVLGNNASIKSDNDVFVLGSLPQDFCMQIYKSCDWMFHLAWLDHCPNTVVEALSCGLPVVCSEDGGTKEIVKDFGKILNEEVPYDYRLVSYDRPPKLNFDQIIGPLPEKERLGSYPSLRIEDTAKSYLNIFENILKDQ